MLAMRLVTCVSPYKNTHAPRSSAKTVNTRSSRLLGTMSPYPIVVIVVMAQYTHAAYCVNRDSSSKVRV